MNIKLELIQSHITEMVAKLLEDNIIDYSTIADTNAIILLDKIKKIISTVAQDMIFETLHCIFYILMI